MRAALLLMCQILTVQSALAERKDCKSFVSGDKTGKIIIWNDKKHDYSPEQWIRTAADLKRK